MKEVKSPKKPLLYYYGIVLLILFLFNMFVTPMIMENRVKEVDYGTFMNMTEDKNIGEVEISDSQILFTDKAETQIYRTGTMDDPNLTERLYEAGATFSKNIEKKTSPLLSGLLYSCPLSCLLLLDRLWDESLSNMQAAKMPCPSAWERAMLRFMCSPRKVSTLTM